MFRKEKFALASDGNIAQDHSEAEITTRDFVRFHTALPQPMSMAPSLQGYCYIPMMKRGITPVRLPARSEMAQWYDPTDEGNLESRQIVPGIPKGMGGVSGSR